MEASTEASTGAFNGVFHYSILACFVPMQASRSLHRFRGSFHLQRNALPGTMEASVEAMEVSVEAMEASMEAVEILHFLWN